MISNDVVMRLRQEIKRHDKPENRLNYQRFSKEKLKEPEGIKTGILRSISNRIFKGVGDLPPEDILNLCDQILATKERYMRFFAFEWAVKMKGRFAKSDFNRFEAWIKKYVNGWGPCDHLCCGALGHLIYQYPDLVKKTKIWTKSDNQWLRRAAAVSLIVPATKGELLSDVFDTADRLLTDDEDLVQKGYGWMLKEASNAAQTDVFNYVMKHKAAMPRTALRYAIEKMPAAMRKRAMAK